MVSVSSTFSLLWNSLPNSILPSSYNLPSYIFFHFVLLRLALAKWLVCHWRKYQALLRTLLLGGLWALPKCHVTNFGGHLSPALSVACQVKQLVRCYPTPKVLHYGVQILYSLLPLPLLLSHISVRQRCSMFSSLSTWAEQLIGLLTTFHNLLISLWKSRITLIGC